MFSTKLNIAMQELHLNQRQVCGLTGKSKGSVSQYLSGRQVPPEKVQVSIAVALGLPADYFKKKDEVVEALPTFEVRNGIIPKLDVITAARLLQMNHRTLRKGLQQGATSSTLRLMRKVETYSRPSRRSTRTALRGRRRNRETHYHSNRISNYLRSGRSFRSEPDRIRRDGDSVRNWSGTDGGSDGLGKETRMRFTEHDERGNWGLKGFEFEQLREGEIISKKMAETLYGVLAKLRDYEDIEEDPYKMWIQKHDGETAGRIADEKAAAYMEDADAKADRMLFVRNLGWVLSQTREGVITCELDNNEVVTVYFTGGKKKVNVACDSYAAIVKDVVKVI